MKMPPARLSVQTQKKSSSGFTLLELLLVLAILTALVCVGLPSFAEFRERQSADITIKRVAQAVSAARASAVNHNSLVTLCRTEDRANCGGSWQQGMLIFTDRNGDRKLNEDDRIIRYLSFPEAQGSLSWRAFGRRNYLQFTSLGNTRVQNGSFTYCPFNKKPELARQLIINRSARARLARDENGDGVVDTTSGRPLPCD